jgi:uncharacterized protein YegP (UPF0339 family)
MPEAEFEIFKDVMGQFRFRLRDTNAEIVAQSEAYTSKRGCLDTICSIKEHAPSAKIVDRTETPPKILTCK